MNILVCIIVYTLEIDTIFESRTILIKSNVYKYTTVSEKDIIGAGDADYYSVRHLNLPTYLLKN